MLTVVERRVSRLEHLSHERVNVSGPDAGICLYHKLRNGWNMVSHQRIGNHQLLYGGLLCAFKNV